MVEQVPALLGVVVGVAATYVTASLGERSRWRRDQRVRREDRRLEAYSAYALTLKRQQSIILRLASGRGLPGALEPLAPQESARLVGEAEDERTSAWEGVLLAGSEEAVVAGRRWHDAVAQMYRVARGLESASLWPEAVRAASSARGQFYVVVRADVGSEPAVDPSVFEWQVSRLLEGR